MDALVQALDLTAVLAAIISVGAAVVGVSAAIAGLRMVMRLTRIPENETWEEFRERVRREHGWDV